MSDETQPPTGATLGNQYALHALRERRAEMAGNLIQAQCRVRGLKRNLASLDATLAIMSPGFDVSSIRPKRPRPKLFGVGVLNRLILDALRRGARPMSVTEVCEAMSEAAGLGPVATADLRRRVHSNLLYLRKRGTVTKDGERASATWALAATAKPL